MSTVYRKMQETDRHGVVSLWRTVFNDSEAFINASLDEFVQPQNQWIAIEGETVVANLSAVPCTAGGREGVYLYALATHPVHRGHGLMSKLMQVAEQDAITAGKAFACLIPAGAALFEYYEKRDYTIASGLRVLNKDIRPDVLATASFDTLTAAGFAEARAQYMDFPYVAFSVEATGMQVRDLYASGATTVKTKHGYAVYFAQSTHTAFVAELMADSTAGANVILQAIREHSGCESALLTLSEDADIFAGEGRLMPHALFKPLSGDIGQSPYLRFGFEEMG